MRPILSPCVMSSPRSIVFAGSGGGRGVLSALAVTMICCSVARGQAPTKLVSVDSTLTTRDGQEIKITYFKSPLGQEAPVVILLPGKGGNRLIWKPFAEQLQKVDFAVITVDMRGHGESAGAGAASGSSTKKPEPPKKGEFIGMAFDLDAVKRFLFEEHQTKQLNMNKLGIVASDIIAPVAIVFTEADWLKEPHDDAAVPGLRTPRGQDVQALALLSPEASAPGLGTPKSLAFIRTLGRTAVLITVGSKNTTDLAAAKKMQEILDPKNERGKKDIFLEQYDTKLHGTNLLGQGLKTEQHLYTFLMKHVKETTNASPWRDRKSKLLD